MLPILMELALTGPNFVLLKWVVTWILVFEMMVVTFMFVGGNVNRQGYLVQVHVDAFNM